MFVTYVVVEALSSAARDKRIADEAGFAEADWPVIFLPVLAGFAVGVVSARVRVAQVAQIERPASCERMSSVALGATADGFVILDAAISALSARSRARIDALEIKASLIPVALFVLGALWIAA